MSLTNLLSENQLFANRYSLIKRLGQGSFAEVWKAEDTKVDNMTVALKIYEPDNGLDANGVKLFGEEFAIVFDLRHQNLLTPSAFDIENNSPYLVLPFCERGSSSNLAGNMNEIQIAQFLHDVSSALDYLHDADIVHQDIKPDNILIDSNGNFLVTDFGISIKLRKTLRPSLGFKSLAGTMAYMAPERFNKDPKPTKACDIWSLGATTFELMTGEVPFGNNGGGFQKNGAEIPYIQGPYSSSLKALVTNCLSEEPWRRPLAVTIRNICKKYFLTGSWDLSSLKMDAPSNIASPQRIVSQPKTQQPQKESRRHLTDRNSAIENQSPTLSSNKNRKTRTILLLTLLFLVVATFFSLIIINITSGLVAIHDQTKTDTITQPHIPYTTDTSKQNSLKHKGKSNSIATHNGTLQNSTEPSYKDTPEDPRGRAVGRHNTPSSRPEIGDQRNIDGDIRTVSNPKLPALDPPKAEPINTINNTDKKKR